MQFLSKNYINVDDTVNVSSNDGLKGNAYDRLATTYWASTGETAEGGTYPTYYEVIFYEGSSTINRVIDTLVLQYINLKAFKIQYWNGAAYADFTGGVFTVNAAASLRIKLATPVTTSKIKIIMDSTIVAGQEKSIGEFWACLQTLDINFRSSRSQNDYLLGANYRLADAVLETWFLASKKELPWTLANITDANLVSLKAIYDTHAPFSIYIDYDRDINSIILGQWTGAWRIQIPEPRVPLTSVNFDFKEQ
jgi:hypothetical protein